VKIGLEHIADLARGAAFSAVVAVAIRTLAR